MRGYLFDAAGKIKPVGTMVRNPAYAATLRRLAAKGADAFYTGEIADDMVAAVRTHANPGTLSLDDLAPYRVRDVEPVCATYRVWRLCGVPPSSSGGIGVLQVLGELARFDLASVRPGSVGALHLITEAERLAFADRGRYLADDRFVGVPVAGLVDPAYIAARSQLIASSLDGRRAGRHARRRPRGLRRRSRRRAAGATRLGRRSQGNAVALVEHRSRAPRQLRMVRGFFLNNQLTDFSFVPVRAARRCNAVAPGRSARAARWRLSTSLRCRQPRLEMVIGSPGGVHHRFVSEGSRRCARLEDGRAIGHRSSEPAAATADGSRGRLE
jgi:gamma-glutamyltranspeptidase/glutathione hydrolase